MILGCMEYKLFKNSAIRLRQYRTLNNYPLGMHPPTLYLAQDTWEARQFHLWLGSGKSALWDAVVGWCRAEEGLEVTRANHAPLSA